MRAESTFRSSMTPATAPFHEIVSARRRRLIVFLVLIPVFVGSLDLTIVSAILPEILTRLNIPIETNLALAAWMVTGYLLAYTVSMMVMGRVSDMVGRRGAFLVCLTIFIFGSYWVATANQFPTVVLNDFARRVLGQRPDLNTLTLVAIILGRVIQALGAGAIVPVSVALVADLYPPSRRAGPVGLVGAFDTLGWVLGHLYGGLTVNFLAVNGAGLHQTLSGIGLGGLPMDWRLLFYINVPLGLFAFFLMWRALRRVEHPISAGRFDVLGALLIALALVALVLGLGGNTDVTGATSLRNLGESALPYNPVLLLAALGLFVIFVAWEWRAKYPLLELHFFRDRSISAATVTNLLVGFCLMLGLVSVPLLVNLQAENASAVSIALAAERAGILLSALTIPMALAAIPGGWLSGKIGYRTTTLLGMGLAGVGFISAGTTWRLDSPPLMMAFHMTMVGVGLGLTIAPIGTVVINHVDESRRGVASALVLIMRLIGMTVAIASMTTFALNRVGQLVTIARVSFPGGLTAQEVQGLSTQAYIASGVQVIGELLVVGGIVCAVALLPTLLIRARD
ncbi:MAG TPA: MFS transporter [Aggregatilineales bacterium]|nr:MFS transporter [Anaerolineales bacterium]HRE46609.1 MFS transporter [Aggregatilineales bacterium]